MKRFLTAMGLITALGAGAFALNAVLPAGAQPSSVSTAASDAPSTGSAAPGGHPAGQGVKAALDKLVADGTLTADQEQKVEAALTGVAKGRFGKGKVGTVLNGGLNVAACTIGIDASELKADLKNGQSIAEVATAHKVDPQKVIDALVAAGDARIDKAVTNGRLTADQAAKAKDRLPQLVQKLVK